ncbi:MAG: NUDIX hydrolase [Planctomycetaceae bacterium]
MNIPISKYGNFQRCVPAGDTHERDVCRDCGWVHYENPRIIVSAVCCWEQQILLCRRAIPPRYGFWSLPGGFLEIGETAEEGACREVREEAGADVRIRSLLATYSIPRIGQVHLVYLADLTGPAMQAGDESLDVGLFPPAESQLPWDELAFPVNHWTLRDYLSLNGRPVLQPFTSRPEHRGQRIPDVAFHPDFPPPEGGL